MAILVVGVYVKGLCCAEFDTTDVVHAECLHLFLFVEGVDVHLVIERLDYRFSLLLGVTDDVLSADREWALGEPTNHGFDILCGCRWVVRLNDHVTA